MFNLNDLFSYRFKDAFHNDKIETESEVARLGND